MIKVGITGDRNYRNKSKIIKLLSHIKGKHGPTAKIITGGQNNGADSISKKYAIELSLPYGEFNPAFSGHKMYSILDESYFRNKERFHFTHLIDRYSKMFFHCDVFYVFLTDKDDIPNDIKHLINLCIKNNKKYKTIT